MPDLNATSKIPMNLTQISDCLWTKVNHYLITMDKHYTAGKITMALAELATGHGDLQERVAEAHRLLLRCSCRDGFEQEFESIQQALQTVVHGDYSRVSDEELSLVANTIVEMNNRVCNNSGVEFASRIA